MPLYLFNLTLHTKIIKSLNYLEPKLFIYIRKTVHNYLKVK
jgi:hypothetical protein